MGNSDLETRLGAVIRKVDERPDIPPADPSPEDRSALYAAMLDVVETVRGELKRRALEKKIADEVQAAIIEEKARAAVDVALASRQTVEKAERPATIAEQIGAVVMARAAGSAR